MTRRQVIFSLAGANLVIFGLAAMAQIGGYRLNLTPSEPLGLWRIEPLHRPVETGDLVFVCPPMTATFKEAGERGYLRRGLCASGFAPLIKTVVALGGQHVEIINHVIIDGRALPASTLRQRDGNGRKLTFDPGGVVPPGHLFLHSSFESSYDSRYFGPIHVGGVLGLARPILTVDP
jgi:conjugative transfer signal peptidase TraF